VPGYVHSEIAGSADASDESRQRAQNQAMTDQSIRSAREGVAAPAVSKATAAARLNRVIYDAEGKSDLPGDRKRKEGQTTALDTEETNVW
jgi:hypothetical protein